MRIAITMALPALTFAVAHAATYTAYIGDTYQYEVSAIAADSAGNTYVTGSRVIAPGSTDVFVTKVDPSGNSTLLGSFIGNGSDKGYAIAVDPMGGIYLAGETTSSDFPLFHPIQTTVYNAGESGSGGSGFLIKLAPDGTVVYSTYLGGTQGSSLLYGVATDSQGNAYVTGLTMAPDHQQTQGMPADSVAAAESFGGIAGAFIAKLDPTGQQVLFAGTLTAPGPGCQTGQPGSSCFLTNAATFGSAIAVDPVGNAYIAGNGGFGLATTPGALLMNGFGAFVAKINADGSGVAYATYLGPGILVPSLGTSDADDVSAIAVDAAGNAYLTGGTSDPAFPATKGAFQPTLAGPVDLPNVPPPDAFVAKLNSTGSAMVWATYLGGSSADGAYPIAVDPGGDVWVSGTTVSPNFPVTVGGTPYGSEFLAELSADGSTLSYSAVLSIDTVAAGLAVDSTGTVHVAGATGLVEAFPVGSAPGQTSMPTLLGLANSAGGLLTGRIVPAELFSIYGLQFGPAAPAVASFDTAGYLPTTLSGLQVTVNGIPAPLLYVSATQINAVAPAELIPGSRVAMQITSNGIPLPDFDAIVDTAAPAVFQIAAGVAVAINQDLTLNSPSNPAPAGSYIAIWATGTGYSPAPDGQMATEADVFCSVSEHMCPVYQSDGTPVKVYYTGAAPETVAGLIQINFQVTGSQTYYFSADGVGSVPFSVYVAP